MSSYKTQLYSPVLLYSLEVLAMFAQTHSLWIWRYLSFPAKHPQFPHS